MKELSATAERSQRIWVPAGQLWPLLSGPQAWSARPDRFAFDVTVPPGTRLRVVLGVNGTRPVVSTYELADEAPGLAVSMRAVTQSAFCWPGNLPGGKSETFAFAMADAAQRAANGYRDLIGTRASQQP